MLNPNFEYLAEPQLCEQIYAANEFVGRQEIEAEAWQLIEQRDQLPSVEVKFQERRNNARTALMEALTASGHLSTVEIHGSLEEIHAQVLKRLLNGWDESLPAHEKNRRFAELCNELIIQRVQRAIVGGSLPPDTEVSEISDYPEALRGLRIGYRDSNKKGMIRTTGLISHGNGQYTRVIEQISRSNGTWPSTFRFLATCNTQTLNKPADIAVLEAPVIYTRRDYVDGVVDIMRQLDQHSGVGVLYGDDDERKLKHPAYESLREESARREQEILIFVDDLAELEIQLDKLVNSGTITEEERRINYEEEIVRILDAICILEPDYAEDTFGKQSAAVFEQAAVLTAQGFYQEAANLLETNNHLKQTVTFCGVSISIEKAQEMGLKVNSLGDLVEKGKNSWEWKQGICVVKSCPTRPGKTQVGPCSVCKHCQNLFDAGKDPTKLILSTPKVKKTAA